MSAALAKLVLEFDARWPGDPSASMDLPAGQWRRLVALARAEAPKPYRVAILACSKSKLAHPAPAEQLYTGALFKASLAVARKLADRVLILSAKHAVVHGDQVLEPYDLSLAQQNLSWWAGQASAGLVRELHAPPKGVDDRPNTVPPREVLCLAPASYTDHLFVKGSHDWAKPLKGMGIGAQKAELKRLLEAA